MAKINNIIHPQRPEKENCAGFALRIKKMSIPLGSVGSSIQFYLNESTLSGDVYEITDLMWIVSMRLNKCPVMTRALAKADAFSTLASYNPQQNSKREKGGANSFRSAFHLSRWHKVMAKNCVNQKYAEKFMITRYRAR